VHFGKSHSGNLPDRAFSAFARPIQWNYIKAAVCPQVYFAKYLQPLDRRRHLMYDGIAADMLLQYK
jgi:hypothetical protein